MPDATPQSTGSASPLNAPLRHAGHRRRPRRDRPPRSCWRRRATGWCSEKARHPRFHIGESLLPANLPLLERLGVAEKVRAIGMEKWGAEFISPGTDGARNSSSRNAWDKSLPLAYQVRRSEFDEILIRRRRRAPA
jgi:hypothetical protein